MKKRIGPKMALAVAYVAPGRVAKAGDEVSDLITCPLCHQPVPVENRTPRRLARHMLRVSPVPVDVRGRFRIPLVELAAGFESYPMCDAVAAYAEEHAGKSVTARDVKKLEAKFPGWCFSVKRSKFSFVQGVTLSFWKTNKWTETEQSLTVSATSSHATWLSGEALKAHSNNARYFHYAAERNAERAELLDPAGAKFASLARATVLAEQLALLYQELKGELEASGLDSSATWALRDALKTATGEDFRL